MKETRIQATSVALCMALSFSACQNLSPGENAAVFGVLAGAATAIPLAVAGVDPSITIPVSIGAAALAAGGAYVISKNQATERQRKIAEQRARLYMAKQEAQEKADARAAASSSTASRSKKQKETRYIAVATEKSSANKGQTAVMLYDTKSDAIVGNSVYDVKSAPKVGSVSKFDTYTAEYVGSGS